MLGSSTCSIDYLLMASVVSSETWFVTLSSNIVSLLFCFLQIFCYALNAEDNTNFRSKVAKEAEHFVDLSKVRRFFAKVIYFWQVLKIICDDDNGDDESDDESDDDDGDDGVHDDGGGGDDQSCIWR